MATPAKIHMTTELVNIRNTPESAIDRCIDRRSDFGNPFKMQKDGGEYSREGCVEAYREWFYSDEQADLRERAIEELQGKTIACWCSPKPCHGDVIVGFLDGMECHECGRRHSDWKDDGKHIVDDGHHAGTVKRWECGNCGSISEIAQS